jgi:serine/threonine-protein phosphatase 2B regulatory subunit
VWYKKDGRVKRLPPIPMFGTISNRKEVFDPEIVSPTAMSLKPVPKPEASGEDCPANLVLLQRCFNDHAGKDGILQQPEFDECLRELGVKNDRLKDMLWASFDPDGNGLVDSRELINRLKEMFAGPEEEKMYKRCFKLYDLDGSGKISLSELQTVAKGSQTAEMKGITEHQRTTLIHLFKNSTYIDDDGILEFPEFCTLMRNEPTLVNAMFTAVATFWAKKMGFTFDFENPSTPSSKARPRSVLSRQKTNS